MPAMAVDADCLTVRGSRSGFCLPLSYHGPARGTFFFNKGSPSMARLVRHTATGPQEVKPQEKSVWICMCGLSQNPPFCDGAHKAARQEEADKCYVYDHDRSRVVEVKDES